MTFIKRLFIILTLLPLVSCNTEWTNLLDKDLSHWDTYLSYAHKPNYNGSQPTDSLGKLIEPIGINMDTTGVFSFCKIDNEDALAINGKIYGCLVTKNEYANYHLKLDVKWGDKKFDPRKHLLKDSGILYHSIGPHGAEYFRSWMRSIEFQVQEGHMGDFWGQNMSAVDVRAFIPEYIMNPVADKTQAFIEIGPTGGTIEDYCMRSANYEIQDSWNTLELVCFNNKSLHIVNGEVVMILQNHRHVENNKSYPLKKGKIQIQCEAAEVFYKNIKIRSITNLEPKYAEYFIE